MFKALFQTCVHCHLLSPAAEWSRAAGELGPEGWADTAAPSCHVCCRWPLRGRRWSPAGQRVKSGVKDVRHLIAVQMLEQFFFVVNFYSSFIHVQTTFCFPCRGGWWWWGGGVNMYNFILLISQWGEFCPATYWALILFPCHFACLIPGYQHATNKSLFPVMQLVKLTHWYDKLLD